MKQLLITIAALVLVGCGESQQSAPSVESPNAKSQLLDGVDLKKKDEWGETFLHREAKRGSIEDVEAAIAKGADVNTRDNFGYTPLHAVASESGRSARFVKMAELLITAGANVNAITDEGDSVLDWNYAEESRREPEKKLGVQFGTLLRKHGAKTGEELKAEGK